MSIERMGSRRRLEVEKVTQNTSERSSRHRTSGDCEVIK